MVDDRVELRVRVKPIVKKRLEELKALTGLGINWYVNYAVIKQLILDGFASHFEFENDNRRIQSNIEIVDDGDQYTSFCSKESCEIPIQLGDEENV